MHKIQNYTWKVQYIVKFKPVHYFGTIYILLCINKIPYSGHTSLLLG